MFRVKMRKRAFVRVLPIKRVYPLGIDISPMRVPVHKAPRVTIYAAPIKKLKRLPDARQLRPKIKKSRTLQLGLPGIDRQLVAGFAYHCKRFRPVAAHAVRCRPIHLDLCRDRRIRRPSFAQAYPVSLQNISLRTDNVPACRSRSSFALPSPEINAVPLTIDTPKQFESIAWEPDSVSLCPNAAGWQRFPVPAVSRIGFEALRMERIYLSHNLALSAAGLSREFAALEAPVIHELDAQSLQIYALGARHPGDAGPGAAAPASGPAESIEG